MNNNIILRLEKVSFSHEKGEALQETSIEFHKGQNTVILGPNGAGKSILLKLCHGLLEPTTGQLHFANGQKNTSMVFSKPVFLRRTVLENLEYVLEIKCAQKNKNKETALNALRQFSMLDFTDYPARNLSSGEKQRLSVIRAHLLEPDILFLDEPTANLDPTATATLEKMIKKTNMTTIMATHDLMQAKRIAEHIIFIDRGKITECNDATTFFNGPSTLAAQRFIAGKL